MTPHNDLRPCPFCGSKATSYFEESDTTSEKHWQAHCPTQGCLDALVPVSIWNRRPSPSLVSPLREALEDLCERAERGRALVLERDELRGEVAALEAKVEALEAREKWFLGALADAERAPEAPALPMDLDPDWMADREMGPVGINRDLWRSLHDLCRIVRSTSGESIRSHLEAYLAGSLDEFGLKLNLAVKVAPSAAGPLRDAKRVEEPGDAMEREILVGKLRTERRLQAHIRRHVGEDAWSVILDTYQSGPHALEAESSPPLPAGEGSNPPKAKIYCREMKKKNGCQLHNLHCGYPKCNEPPEGSEREGKGVSRG